MKNGTEWEREKADDVVQNLIRATFVLMQYECNAINSDNNSKEMRWRYLKKGAKM